jgi:alcohol dehydrogenase class IV
MWAEKALTLMARSFRTAVAHGDDQQARGAMALAATVAGLGFGNAGVHIPHADAYPIAGQVREFHPRDYPDDEPLVPHGMAVALTAPEAFRFTFDAAPERHIRAARLLEPDAVMPDDPAALLPDVLRRLMRDIAMPPGIGAIGFGDNDVEDLVDGALKQQRLLATAPREVNADDLDAIFRRSMTLW